MNSDEANTGAEFLPDGDRRGTTASGDEYLPVLDLDFLPVLQADLGPEHEKAPPGISGWTNWAHQRQVRDVARCAQSNELWLATGGGVLRWFADRQRFTRYTSEHGLPGNAVMAIVVDRLRRVWCAPDHGGLYLFEDRAWSRHPVPDLQELPIRCLTMDESGYVWAGTREAIFQLHFDCSLARRIEFDAVEPPRSIAIAASGEVWVCSSRGLLAHSGSKSIQAGTRPTLLTLAGEGDSMWVGKLDGLVRIDLTTRRASTEPHWPTGSVTAILPMQDSLLITCDGRLLSIAGAEVKELLTFEGHCARLVWDGADGVWLGTDRGLLHWSASKPERYLETQAPPDRIRQPDPLAPPTHLGNLIQALAVIDEPEGSVLWLGTPLGLFRHDPASTALVPWSYHPVDGLGEVHGLASGMATGELLLSSWDGGAYRYLPRTRFRQRMQMPDPRVHEPIFALAAGLDGTSWAIGLRGLYRSAGTAWELVLAESQVGIGTTLQAVAQGHPDEVWLGTSLGLIRYDPVADVVLSPVSNAFYSPVNALAYDAANQLMWAGTSEGLFALQRAGDGWREVQGLSTPFRDNGLASRQVLSLATDTRDFEHPSLWIGTSNGLSRYEYELT